MSRAQVVHPDFAIPVSFERIDLPDAPDWQVSGTVDVMARYAREDARCSCVQRDASEALAMGDGDPVLGVYQLVKSRMSFQSDARTSQPIDSLVPQSKPVVEVLIRPADLSVMTNAVGDCDDYSMYCAALLIALGVECAFATVGAEQDDPTVYSHVYVVAYPASGERIPLDCSHGPYAGWEAPNAYGKFREWPITPGAGSCHPLVPLLLIVGAFWLSKKIGGWFA